MLEEKKRIVKIIAEILDGKDQDFVALRSIDARLLLNDSELVFTGKMIEKIHELVQEGYLKWKNENYSSVGFSRKGLEYYTKTKKRNPLEQLKEEFEHLKKIVMKRFSNSKELQQYRIQHKSQFDRYYFLVEEIERLEWDMLTPMEQARQKEVEKLSKLKRESKLYDYLINKRNNKIRVLEVLALVSEETKIPLNNLEIMVNFGLTSDLIIGGKFLELLHLLKQEGLVDSHNQWNYFITEKGREYLMNSKRE